jgi:hypothetical protein
MPLTPLVQKRTGGAPMMLVALLLHAVAVADTFCPCEPYQGRIPRDFDDCTESVCRVASSCCDISWDSMCAELANSICGRCSVDCDLDGSPDACEADRNANGVPDECEPAQDCNGNGIDDALDIQTGRSLDCGRIVGKPDECEIAEDPTLDLDRNGVLDACEQQPCRNGFGPDSTRWIGLPNSEQSWEAPYNWLPSQSNSRNRPGWNSTVRDALFTPRIMDAALHCDQEAGAMDLAETQAFIALGDSTLEFLDAFGTREDLGVVRLEGTASLVLDPRWTERTARNGLLRTGRIESIGSSARTQLWSSPATRIHASERISLSGCEILLSGDTATPLFETLSRTVMDARGTLRPLGTASAPGTLDVRTAGTLRAWRLPFDSTSSLTISNLNASEQPGIVERIEHASTPDNPATLLVLWDWTSLANSSVPVIDASQADARVQVRGALQIDTSLAAGTMPASGQPSLELIRQAASLPLGRYGLISGTPPRGMRFEQREATVETEGGTSAAHSLLLAVVPDSSADPSVGAGVALRLDDSEMGKVAMDLDGDGADEVVVAVRRSGAPGEIRVYKVEGNRLVQQAAWTKILDAGDASAHDSALVQPIRPWNGTTGDGQPLDAGDFDGDGDVDLAVACEGNAPFRLFVNVRDPSAPDRPIFADPINAASLEIGTRPTCVAIVPHTPGNSVAAQAPGFVGGVATAGDTGILYRYSVAALTAQRGAGVQVAGVPRSTRGGGTVGTQGVGIATGGSTKTKTFNLVEAWTGFVQWVRIDNAWNPQDPQSTGLSANAAPVELASELPSDLVVVPVPLGSQGGEPICIATANAPGSASDVTVLRGSGVGSAASTGLDSIVPLRTASGTQGSVAIAAANVFIKAGAVIPDLIVTRSDGAVSAARTDLDGVGGLAIGYVVRIAQAPGTRRAVACGPGGAPGTIARALVTTVPSTSILGSSEDLILQPLGEVSAREPSADLDGSGLVDFGDVNLLLLDMGPCPACTSDLDGNGVVDFGDVTLVLLSFGETS